MTEIRFRKGEFVSLRAIHDIRVTLDGEPSTIYKNDIIGYDGHTLMLDGSKFRISTLKGAVQKGWFVPPEDTETEYVAESAIKSMRPADMTKANAKAGDLSVITVQDEERVVGHYQGEKKPLRETSTLRVKKAASEDGVVVARMKNPSKNEFKVDGVTDIDRREKAIRGNIKEIIVPGDQIVGLAGDNLDDVFPEAASSRDHYPEPGVAGEGASKKEEAARAAAERKKHRIAQAEGRPVADEDESWVGKASTGKEREDSEEEAEVPEFIRTSVGIDWDLSPHWRKRAKIACERYGNSDQILESILEVEQEGVVNFIREFMNRKNSEKLVVDDSKEEIPPIPNAKVAETAEEISEVLD